MFIWQPDELVPWADGIPSEADRMVATGVSVNASGTPWDRHRP